MKKVLILFSRQAVAKDETIPARLGAALSAGAQSQHLSLAFSQAFLDDLIHVITPKGARLFDMVSGTDTADYDAVYLRHRSTMSMAGRTMAVARYLTKKQVPYIDREEYGCGSLNKMTEAWRYWEAALPHPDTAYADRGAAMDWLVEHIEELPFGFPMILKGINATRGSNNYLIDSVAMLKARLAECRDVQFVMQEFIPNDGDYRVIVCGDEVRLVLKHVASSGKHINNTSQGGKATLAPLTEIPEAVRRDCVRAAQIIGRDFAGVDVVLNKQTGNYLFFEVNRAPQVGSGSYVPEKAAELARYLAKIAG